MMFWMMLYGILDVNTDCKKRYSTIRDHPTIRFDVSPKLSAPHTRSDYPLRMHARNRNMV